MLPRKTIFIPAVLVLVAGCETGTGPEEATPPETMLALSRTAATLPLTPEVFATGFEFPRGMAWAPNGDMYVAEAGTGGSNATTPEQCQQVPGPVGPYTAGPTSRISRVDKHGNVTVFATGFPSAQNQLGPSPA
jgi:glucose/arabinose dehydrogenase